MKVYVVRVTGVEYGTDTTPFIMNDRAFTTRAAAMREAQHAADCFVNEHPDAKLTNYSTEIVVGSIIACTNRAYTIEELELVEE